MGILSWHKLAELLEEAVSFPQFLVPALMAAGVVGALAHGPGLIFLQLYSEPTAEPAKQNQICPGSVPRSSS